MRITNRIGEEVESKGPHRDYDLNLSSAIKFITNIQKTALSGMSIQLKDSDQIKRSLLAISWIPPNDAHMGNYCRNIFLHQSYADFQKEMTDAYNAYYKSVKEFWEKRNPTQLLPPLPETAQKASEIVQVDLKWWDR